MKSPENPHEILWFSTFFQGVPSWRQAELDAQLLANRIALLKQEEEKARPRYQWLMVEDG
jgi:hypothetical protein